MKRRSVEDECVDYQEILMGDVPVRMGVPNIAEYRQKLKAEADSGRKVMKPFTKWNTEKLGSSDNTAEKDSMVVWRVLRSEMSPADLVYDVTKPKNYRNTIKASVRKFCAFLLQDRDSSVEDKKWARETLMALTRTTKPEALSDSRREKNTIYTTGRPLTNTEFKALLVEITTIKNPYMYAILGLMLHTGMSQVEACYCTKIDIETAMETGGMRIRGTKMGQRVVSCVSGKKFLKILIDYPWDWGILADILSPDIADNAKITSAKKKIVVALKRCAASTGIQYKGLIKKIRMALAYKAYKNHNELYASQYLAYTNTTAITRIIYAFEDPRLFTEKWEPE